MQETETLKLPISGKEVLVRGYVTGLIDQEVRKVEMSANKVKYEVDVDSPKNASPDPNQVPDNAKIIMESDPSVQIEADNKLLELMVLAVDGNNGDVVNQLLALPAADVRFVQDKVKALREASKLDEDQKKA